MRLVLCRSSRRGIECRSWCRRRPILYFPTGLRDVSQEPSSPGIDGVYCSFRGAAQIRSEYQAQEAARLARSLIDNAPVRTCRDGASRGIDVEMDEFLRVIGFEEEQLSHDRGRDRLINFAIQTNDSFLCFP